MRKINIDSEEQAVLDFIESLKNNPLLEGYDIDIYNANQFSLMLEEKQNCSNCQGLADCKNSSVGYALEYVDGEFVLNACHYKKEALVKANEGKLIKTLFVPKSILNAHLEDYECNTDNRKKIYEYILKVITKFKNNEFFKGLYLYGGFSTGKTFILGVIANELAKNNIESLLIYFPDLVVELKNAIGTARFEELMNYLKSVPVLILDDLGSENMTPWLRDEILGPVFNYRLMEEKPIFISSNLNPKNNELLSHLCITKASSDVLKGKRIQSRLEGLVVPIELENTAYKR